MKTTKARPFNYRRSVAIASLALFALLARHVHASAAVISGTTSSTVLWISVPSAASAAGNYTMVNHDKTFLPSLLVVPVGSTVRFPNEDPFYHSIYSDSPLDPFDIGYYDTGPGKVVRFAKAAIVNVHCHIHVYMHATIVVVDGPFARADDGRYRLQGIPSGTYVLHAWDALHGERTQKIRIPSADAKLTINL